MSHDAGPRDLIDRWIARAATPAGADWLRDRTAAVAADPSALGPALSLAPRRVGRGELALTGDDRATAGEARPGWDPSGWTLGEAARVRLLLAVPAEGFAERLRGALATADLGESVAAYKGLPLYPEPDALVPLAADGLRTAMRTVFEAVAHRNPFPAERFPQGPWNHMVLKALFIDSTLGPIVGLDRRWNAELAGVLRDYAHERWAAGRPVTPELWRGVGRFADAGILADLARVLATGTAPERRAAALALHDCDQPGAARLLDGAPNLADHVRAGRLTWATMDTG